MNNNLTELIFILDASGSMYSLTDETIGGFNSLIDTHKNEDGECKVTTVLFNSDSRVLHDYVDVKNINKMTDNDYCTYGMTALYDAVGKTIDNVGVRLANTPENERPGHIIVVITTDGKENSSKEYTHERIKEMIELQQNTYNWVFMFLGANINAEEVGKSYGIKSGYSKTYTASTDGVDSLWCAMSATTSYLRSTSDDVATVDCIVSKNLDGVV